MRWPLTMFCVSDAHDYRLPRRRRICGRKQFDAVFQRGTIARGQWMTVYVRRREGGGVGEQETRLGVAASRRLGGAVRRNRAKRLVREAFRLNRCLLPSGCDIIVVPRGDWSGVSLEMAERELIALARRALGEGGEA